MAITTHNDLVVVVQSWPTQVDRPFFSAFKKQAILGLPALIRMGLQALARFFRRIPFRRWGYKLSLDFEAEKMVNSGHGDGVPVTVTEFRSRLLLEFAIVISQNCTASTVRTHGVPRGGPLAPIPVRATN